MINSKNKASILIIADFPNWAYHEIMKFIIENLSEHYDIYYDFLIYNSKKKSKNPIKKIISFFNHYKYAKLKKDCHYDVVFYLAFYFENQIDVKWSSKKIIKGIFTDGFPPSNSKYIGDVDGFIQKYLNNTNAIVCGSKNITDFYKFYFSKTYYANMIIDENIFKRKSNRKSTEKFIVGWTGNPARSFKGFYSHIIPSISILNEKYPNIELKTRFSGPISTLPYFYENVDLVVIASDADAGPSLFVEASLMDIPCVSTDIGWPKEVIINGINGFIVSKEIEEIVNKIEFLYLNREVLNSMSNRIRKDFIKVFDKNIMISNWKQLFDEVLIS